MNIHQFTLFHYPPLPHSFPPNISSYYRGVGEKEEESKKTGHNAGEPDLSVTKITISDTYLKILVTI